MNSLKIGIQFVSDNIIQPDTPAVTGDFLFAACLFFLLCFIVGFVLFMLHKNNGNILNYQAKRSNVKTLALKNNWILQNNKIIVIVVSLLFALIAISAVSLFSNKAYAINIPNNSYDTQNNIIVKVHEDSSLEVFGCEVDNNLVPYSIFPLNSKLNITNEALNIPGLQNVSLNITGFDGLLYNGGSSEDLQVPENVSDLAPGLSTFVTCSFDGLENGLLAYLIGKTAYTLTIYTQQSSNLTIVYETNGGSPAIPNKIDACWNEANLIPLDINLNKDGYVFDGWYSDEDFENKVDVNTKYCEIAEPGEVEITLFAKWVGKTVPIIYMDRKGAEFSGEFNMFTPFVHVNGEDTYLIPPTREGCWFGGWYLDKDCMTFPIFMIDSNFLGSSIVLYTKWYTTATINLDQGQLKAGEEVPPDWTLVDGTSNVYIKTFLADIDYDEVLSEWQDVEIVHSTQPDAYYFIGFTPTQGILKGHTMFKAQFGTLLYSVTIWGINQDGNNTITFGPATGESTDCLDVDGEHEHCIHNDSWETIISNINSGNAHYYDACLEEECTKLIPISYNETLFGDNFPESKVICSNFYNSIVGNGDSLINGSDCYTCYNAGHQTDEQQSAIWTTSRIRATLNGYNNNWGSFTPCYYADPDTCCTVDNCLFSVFPSVLKNNIKTKIYNVPSEWNNKAPYDISNWDQVKDKLWLPAAWELTSSDDYGDEWTWAASNFNHLFYAPNGVDKGYQKMDNNLTSWKSSFLWFSQPALMTWNENGISCSWWYHSPFRLRNDQVAFVSNVGRLGGASYVEYAKTGIAPCFIL